MDKKPSYEELEQKVKELEKESVKYKGGEEVLRQEKKLAEGIIHSLPGLFYMFDEERFVRWNKKWETITGYSPEELGRMHGPDFFEDANREYIADRMQEVFREGASTAEAELVTKDGRRIPYYFTGLRVVFDRKPFLIGMGIDITEVKRAEEALRESEEFLETIIENIPDMIFVKEAKELRFVRFNKAGEELLGYSREELIGKNDYDFFPKEEADFFTTKDRNVLSRGEHLDIPEEPIQTRYKGERILHTKKISILDKEGNPRYLMGISEDITDRKQAEKAMRESEQLFRELFDNMGSGVAIYDSPDNGQSFVFKDLNRAGLEAGQKQKDEVVGREVREVFPGVEALGLFDVFKRVWKTGIPEHHPFSMYKDDKIMLWVENYVCKLPSGELVAIYEDITARKKAEEAKEKLERQLFQTQKIESIGNLAGGIAHDFNNILSSIIGFTELALDDVAKGTPLEDNLQEIFTAGKRAKDLVKQILAFARQSDEERKPIRVDTIAKEVLKLIRSTIPTTIEIKENIESHSLILGNPSQVHLLFLNLFTNAAQAMEDTGGILEVGLIDIEHNDQSSLLQSELKYGNYLKITVSDTGPGIPPDIIGFIFEPYFTTKVIGKGTGMGLAIVHGIVEGYGGKITVDSELSKGTVFSIYLPITKKDEAYRRYEEENLPSGTERILFVDDEFPIAKMGSQILERLGYRVTIRTSSIEALELFRFKTDDFDLVITDMTMPNMTGEKLAIELLNIRPDIPVILCTGYSNKISKDTASEIGIKAFAYKPVEKADLAKTVRKVLDEAKGKA